MKMVKENIADASPTVRGADNPGNAFLENLNRVIVRVKEVVYRVSGVR